MAAEDHAHQRLSADAVAPLLQRMIDAAELHADEGDAGAVMDHATFTRAASLPLAPQVRLAAASEAIVECV
jgi:hypothetical protein